MFLTLSDLVIGTWQKTKQTIPQLVCFVIKPREMRGRNKVKKRFAGRERSPPPSARGHSHAQDPELLEVAKRARDTRIFKHEKETGPVTDACGNVPSAIGHQETDGNHGEPHRLPEGHGRAGQLRDQGAGGHSPLGKASSCVSRRRAPVCPGASWCTGLPTVAYLQTEETARCPREGRRGCSHRREATQQLGRLRSQHHPQRVAGSPETGGSHPGHTDTQPKDRAEDGGRSPPGTGQGAGGALQRPATFLALIRLHRCRQVRVSGVH